MSGNFINSKWLTGNGSNFESYNPANQEVVWSGNSSNQSDVDASIDAAKKSFKLWSRLDFDTRVDYIGKYIDILSNNIEKLADVIHKENGKPLWEAKTEVQTMIAKFKLSVDSYHARTGYTDTRSKSHLGVSSSLVHRPIGVMVVFGPFNFPGHLPNGHIIPALLAGNTIVFKPSDQTPLTGELMIKFWEQAGLPEGVINLVQGDSLTGEYLVKNNNINGVLFTGSNHVGRIIHSNLAGRPEVMLALEMGGNNPLILDREVNDIDAAVYHTIQSIFITSGQRCTCARRLYIPKNNNSSLTDKFISRLVEVSSQLAVSDTINKINMIDAKSDLDYFMGPVISLKSAESIVKFKNKLLEDSHNEELLELRQVDNNSALLTPGIILNSDISYNNLDYDVECFGPLLQIYYYEDLDDAICKANNSKYGLSAGFLSNNSNNIHKFYQEIRAGIVNWNRPTTGAAGSLPFGGIGQSGNYNPSAAYAADYCAYPMASQYSDEISLPETLSPGINLLNGGHNE